MPPPGRAPMGCEIATCSGRRAAISGRQAAMLTISAMREERTDQRFDLGGRVLEHVVAAVGEAVHLRVRPDARPAVEDPRREDEVALAPADQDGRPREARQAGLDLADG